MASISKVEADFISNVCLIHAEYPSVKSSALSDVAPLQPALDVIKHSLPEELSEELVDVFIYRFRPIFDDPAASMCLHIKQCHLEIHEFYQQNAGTRPRPGMFAIPPWAKRFIPPTQIPNFFSSAVPTQDDSDSEFEEDLTKGKKNKTKPTEKTTEERRFVKLRWISLATAAVSFVSYVLLSGLVQIDMMDGDEEEEEGGDDMENDSYEDSIESQSGEGGAYDEDVEI